MMSTPRGLNKTTFKHYLGIKGKLHPNTHSICLYCNTCDVFSDYSREKGSGHTEALLLLAQLQSCFIGKHFYHLKQA